VLEIAYGCGTDVPQYAALHLESGYLRMNYGPESGWGTSVILPPSFWEGGVLYQGAALTASWRTDADDLLIAADGTISNLRAEIELRLAPPAGNSFSALVAVRTTGEAAVDDRPGEGFKLVMLSSMHLSTDVWDAQAAYVDGQTFPIPESQWVIKPPALGTVFGLLGGTSSWKRNAPTVEIRLDDPRAITGWVTPSEDPNDDNVGLWAATEGVVGEWRYVIAVRP
jgi:hypothetical protein